MTAGKNKNKAMAMGQRMMVNKQAAIINTTATFIKRMFNSSIALRLYHHLHNPIEIFYKQAKE